MEPTSIIDRLKGFTADQLKTDAAAKKEALNLSRMLNSALQDPVAEATEAMILVRGVVASSAWYHGKSRNNVYTSAYHRTNH
jgi:hypothetical protein